MEKNIITNRALKRMLKCITSLEHWVTTKAIEIYSSIKERQTKNVITQKKHEDFQKNVNVFFFRYRNEALLYSQIFEVNPSNSLPRNELLTKSCIMNLYIYNLLF